MCIELAKTRCCWAVLCPACYVLCLCYVCAVFGLQCAACVPRHAAGQFCAQRAMLLLPSVRCNWVAINPTSRRCVHNYYTHEVRPCAAWHNILKNRPNQCWWAFSASVYKESPQCISSISSKHLQLCFMFHSRWIHDGRTSQCFVHMCVCVFQNCSNAQCVKQWKLRR